MMAAQGEEASRIAGGSTVGPANITPSSLTIEKFDPQNTTWRRWLQRLQGAFSIFQIAGQSRVPYLLHYIGAAQFDTLCDRLDPVDPFTIPYETLVENLSEFYQPAPLEIAENFRFHCRKQMEEETVQQYAAALHKLSIYCKFGEYIKVALRNQFVFGLKSKKTQMRLLEKKDLTYEEALRVATTMEMSEKGAETLHATTAEQSIDYLQTSNNTKRKSSNPPPRTNHSRSKNSSNFNKNSNFTFRNKDPGKSNSNKESKNHAQGQQAVNCYRCGGEHLATKCKLDRKIKCNYCGMQGHLAKVCFKKGNQINHVEELLYVNAPGNRNKFYCTMVVNNKQIKFEVDTGAAVTVMSEQDFCKLGSRHQIKRTNIQLVSFCKENITVLGYARVHVQFNELREDLDVYITNVDRPPLLGREWLHRFKGQRGLKDMLECFEVSVHSELEALISKYNSVRNTTFDKIKGYSAQLTLKEGATPTFLKPRPVPFRLIPRVEKEIEELVRTGVLTKVTSSEWATPIVPVLKANGTIRLCGDYKVTLNPKLEIDEHPLPTIDELFFKLSGGKQFSKIDLKQAYLQLEVAEQSKHLLTLNTHMGLFRVNRLMYGVAAAPAIWQRTMEQLLRGIPGVAVFLDDILITGNTDKEHLQSLETVLKRLHEHNVKINIEKSSFFQDEITYCGYVLKRDGIYKEKSKMTAICDMPRPRNVKETRAFIGMINYYGRFIEHLSTILHPLHLLLREDVPFHWGKLQEKAFLEAKKAFLSDNVLAHYNAKLPLILATDASPYGVGAVLSQRDENGRERVLQYASRTLSKTQCKYSQIDKEAYSIVYGVKKFHQYLYGNKFRLITDHRPLVQIFAPKKGLPLYSATRMQHYALFLQAFNYTIEYRRSEHNANADCLSRLPVPQQKDDANEDVIDIYQIELINDLPCNAEQIRHYTSIDHELSKWVQALKTGVCIENSNGSKVNLEEFSLKDEIILRGNRVVIPTALRHTVLKELHTGHFGTSRMKTLARGCCWWPGIDKQIEEMVKNCHACNLVRNEPPKVETHVWEPAQEAMHRIHMDVAGPFLGRWFLVTIDAYSKWPDVRILRNLSAEALIDQCRDMFATYGLPKLVFTDNGTNFASAKFREFLTNNGITYKNTAPYHPATNGLAERFVQTLKNGLKRMSATKENVFELLPKFLIMYRATPHPVTNLSPSELFLGRKMRTRLSLIYPSDEITRDIKGSTELKTPFKCFKVGDSVAARNYVGNKKWEFGSILEKTGKLHYNVKTINGKIWKRHVDQLRLVGREVLSQTNYDTMREGDVENASGGIEEVLEERQRRVEEIPRRRNTLSSGDESEYGEASEDVPAEPLPEFRQRPEINRERPEINPDRNADEGDRANEEGNQRPRRERRPPQRYADYFSF